MIFFVLFSDDCQRRSIYLLGYKTLAIVGALQNIIAGLKVDAHVDNHVCCNLIVSVTMLICALSDLKATKLQRVPLLLPKFSQNLYQLVTSPKIAPKFIVGEISNISNVRHFFRVLPQQPCSTSSPTKLRQQPSQRKASQRDSDEVAGGGRSHPVWGDTFNPTIDQPSAKWQVLGLDSTTGGSQHKLTSETKLTLPVTPSKRSMQGWEGEKETRVVLQRLTNISLSFSLSFSTPVPPPISVCLPRPLLSLHLHHGFPFHHQHSTLSFKFHLWSPAFLQCFPCCVRTINITRSTLNFWLETLFAPPIDPSLIHSSSTMRMASTLDNFSGDSSEDDDEEDEQQDVRQVCCKTRGILKKEECCTVQLPIG